MKVGILGAMDEEIMLLLEHYKDYESICFGGNTFYKIKQNGIIIELGIHLWPCRKHIRDNFRVRGSAWPQSHPLW